MLAELWMLEVAQGNVRAGVQTAWQMRKTWKRQSTDMLSLVIRENKGVAQTVSSAASLSGYHQAEGTLVK